MRLCDRDRLCEREPKLKPIDTGDGNGRGRKFKLDLYTVPDSGQGLPVHRSRQLHHHGTHPARGVYQGRWLHVSVNAILWPGEVQAIEL